MNRDDEDAALAHQAELEQRRLEEQALLKNDPDYERWLDELNKQVKHNEISGQSNR